MNQVLSGISSLLVKPIAIGMLLMVGSLAAAQTTLSQGQPITVRDDRAPLRIRYPAPKHIRDLQTDHAYQYDQDAPPPDNPAARFFEWLYHKLTDLLTSKSYRNVWQYVFLVAIAGLVVYFLMKAEILGVLIPKKAQSGKLTYEHLAENIHELDFEATIEKAIGQQNWRLAVRLLYLQTLKHLTDAGQIDYKPQKTNRQYISELAQPAGRSDFEALTQQFEFVWYGDFPIDKRVFDPLRQQFQLFNHSIVHYS